MASKKELQELVSKQQCELSRYKSRLADLVAAHKCLLKEKEALEASLKAINTENSGPLTDIKVTENLGSDKRNDSLEVYDSKDNSLESIEKLKFQLSTLMNSIATLSEEKSRMEASFQVDKRQLRVEKLQLENSLREVQNKLEQEEKKHTLDIENLKSKLIIERHQREKEHNDHGVMIRELQKVVAEERGRREKTEALAENMKRELATSQEDKNCQQKKLNEIAAELEEAKLKLKEDEANSCANTSRLNQQLQELKLQHILVTRKEQERALEAEERAKALVTAHEERVANLEARLAELSATVGTYDRLRYHDKLAIDKLKERLLQLEMEHGEEKSDASVDELAIKFQHLKELIDIANESSEKPLDVKALLLGTVQDYNITLNGHEICQQEYDQLKLEFDNYRKQFQLLQHGPPQNVQSTMRMESNKEMENLKSTVFTLKERMKNLHEQIDNLEREQKKELDLQHQAMSTERARYKERLGSIEMEWRGKVASLESQLSKQRERALALVSEKDQEIALLKENFHNFIPHNKIYSSEKEGEERRESVSNGGPMIHYTHELARRDVELTRLRKDKHSLEAELREASRNVYNTEQKCIQLEEALKKQVERFESCQSREGANLEYLKNVVLSFLLSNDASCKGHMLNAIGAVLKFTDSERNKVAEHSWWYNKIAHSVT